MRAKDIAKGQHYAYSPCQWGKTYVPHHQWWRVEVLVAGTPDGPSYTRHEVVQVDDVSGAWQRYADGNPRIFTATSAELRQTWSEHETELESHWRILRAQAAQRGVLRFA